MISRDPRAPPWSHVARELGRSGAQEAVDEIVTLLTEEEYRGKMVVIFAGYAGQACARTGRRSPLTHARATSWVRA